MSAIDMTNVEGSSVNPLRVRRGQLVLGAAALINVLVWVLAWGVFHHQPALFGMAVLAYGLGLRHAVDADHIAAIDNVTRQMMRGGKSPFGVGFFFSLGHSSVVVLVTLGIAVAAQTWRTRFESFAEVGGGIGTSISVLFLLVIAVANCAVLRETYAKFKTVRAGDAGGHDDSPARIAGLGRFLLPLFNVIRHSWQMFPLGFLFGLGFDTATEVSLLSIAATESSKGLSLLAVMMLPALFTAGMVLIDTLDNILMLNAYSWALVNPLRKLHYNLTVTAVSIIVAVVIGGIEAAGLAVDHFKLRGGLWDYISLANDHFDVVGYVVIGIFACCWLASLLIYRWRGYENYAPLIAQRGQ